MLRCGKVDMTRTVNMFTAATAFNDTVAHGFVCIKRFRNLPPAFLNNTSFSRHIHFIEQRKHSNTSIYSHSSPQSINWNIVIRLENETVLRIGMDGTPCS